MGIGLFKLREMFYFNQFFGEQLDARMRNVKNVLRCVSINCKLVEHIRLNKMEMNLGCKEPILYQIQSRFL